MIKRSTTVLAVLVGAWLGGAATTAHAATIERSVDVTTKEKNPAVARRNLIDQAQTQAIEDLVRETLGPERYQKHRSVIQSKVLKLSSRLIPFSKAGNLESTPEGFKMSVQVRVNVDDLDQLLISQGLYFESDVPPLILPLVAWTDRDEGDRFSWWTGEATQGLANWNLEFEQIARREFLKEGFFILAPQQYRFQEAFTEGGHQLGASDVQRLSAQRQSQVVLIGDVQIHEGGATGRELEVKLSTLHVPRNRILGQVGRRVPLEKNLRVGLVSNRLRDVFEAVAKDLANQTIEAWQRGAIQSNNYRISVAGSLSPAQIEGFRDGFRTKVREVKNLRERLIQASATVFEMDSPIAPKELAQRVAEIEVKGAKMVLKEASADELRYQMIPQ